MNSSEITIVGVLMYFIACCLTILCYVWQRRATINDVVPIPRVTFQVDAEPIGLEEIQPNIIEVVAYQNNIIYEPITVKVDIVDDYADANAESNLY